ncbi:hypothetical protein [Streptomyces sp. NE5-10]|uniref:hypothetical protein n=1 Tax=Streptomyces sp. NE5-10 TaxID=2759674 RepID=UPI001905B31C|nr:hypothetical protein [Streptomyces sp. NE5-10]
MPHPAAEALFVSLVAIGTNDEAVTSYAHQADHVTADSPVTGRVTVTPDRARVTPGTPTGLTAADPASRRTPDPAPGSRTSTARAPS